MNSLLALALAGLARAALVCNSTATEEPSLAQGQSTVLCVHLLPQEVKVAFPVTVDTFVGLTTRRVYDALDDQPTDLAFQLANSAVVSSPSAYVRTGSPGRVFTVFSVLVTLELGVPVRLEVEGIAAACSATAVAEPLISSAYVVNANVTANCPLTPCTTEQNATGKCDFRAMIAWVGTDKNGVGLLSAAERLPNYNHYNMPGLLAGLQDIDNNLNSTTPEAYDSSLLSADVAARLATA